MRLLQGVGKRLLFIKRGRFLGVLTCPSPTPPWPLGEAGPCWIFSLGRTDEKAVCSNRGSHGYTCCLFPSSSSLRFRQSRTPVSAGQRGASRRGTAFVAACAPSAGPLPGQLASGQGGERQNFLLPAAACISVNTKRNHCLFAEGAAPNTASWQYLIRLSEPEGAAHTFRHFGAEIGPGCYPSGLYRELCF